MNGWTQDPETYRTRLPGRTSEAVVMRMAPERLGETRWAWTVHDGAGKWLASGSAEWLDVAMEHAVFALERRP